MKKTLIATACALTLCFTSCATKQAPDTELPAELISQIEAETLEAEKETTDISSEQSSETETQQETTNSDSTTAYAENEDQEQAAQKEEVSSEDFPKPEAIEEPEIITLEPEDDIIEEDTAEETEPVENEVPPELSLIPDSTKSEADNEDNTDLNTEEKTESQTSENNDSSLETENISANDVVIVTTPDTDAVSGGIDITVDDSDSDDKNISEKQIIPSRSVTIKKYEYLDVTYPGTGWIFMGLTDNSKDLAYFGRKLGTKDTKFSLQARAAGNKIIHFYRNDPLTGQYLDDYIEVIILAENGSNKTHVEAPEYTLPVQKKNQDVTISDEPSVETISIENQKAKTPETKKNDITKSEPEKTVSPSETSTPAKSSSKTSDISTSTPSTSPSTSGSSTSVKTESPSSEISKQSSDTKKTETEKDVSTAADSKNITSLLQEAKVLYNEKEYSTALVKLNQFFEYSTDKRDEALYLKGQILEAKSDVRDIKGAIEAYTTLTKNYPASKLWDSANKRIIYLKRFYLEVR